MKATHTIELRVLQVAGGKKHLSIRWYDSNKRITLVFTIIVCVFIYIGLHIKEVFFNNGSLAKEVLEIHIS